MEKEISRLQQIRNTLSQSGIFYEEVMHPIRVNHRKGSSITPHTFFISPSEIDHDFGQFFEFSEKLADLEGLRQLMPGVWQTISVDESKRRYDLITIQETPSQLIAIEKADELRERFLLG